MSARNKMNFQLSSCEQNPDYRAEGKGDFSRIPEGFFINDFHICEMN